MIYPPLGALADHAGGLAGARVLSLVFMLGATTLLWSAARRPYGRRAAFFAAALFAMLGPTLHLGAFATYNALSLFLVAVAAWFVLRAGERGVLPGRMIAAGAALALASAAAYSTVLFDVVVVVLAALAAFPAPGGRAALRRVAILLATVIALLGAGLLIGGSNYLNGFKANILTPVAHTNSPLSVLSSTWYWAGILVVLAAGGVIISAVRREGRAATWLLAVLAAAVILGTAEQAWLHTAALLNQHVGVGAWFAAIAAGYAADRFIAPVPAGRKRALIERGLRGRAGVPGVPGGGPVVGVRDQLAQRDRVHRVLRPLAAHSTGRCWWKTPRSPGTTCRPGTSGGAGRPPATSSCRRGSAPAPLPPQRASSAPAAPPSSPTTSRTATSPTWPSTSLTPPRWTTAGHRARPQSPLPPHHVVPYGTEVKPVGQGTYVIWKIRRRARCSPDRLVSARLGEPFDPLARRVRRRQQTAALRAAVEGPRAEHREHAVARRSRGPVRRGAGRGPARCPGPTGPSGTSGSSDSQVTGRVRARAWPGRRPAPPRCGGGRNTAR